jgi:hypothetical protein
MGAAVVVVAVLVGLFGGIGLLAHVLWLTLVGGIAIWAVRLQLGRAAADRRRPAPPLRICEGRLE